MHIQSIYLLQVRIDLDEQVNTIPDAEAVQHDSVLMFHSSFRQSEENICLKEQFGKYAYSPFYGEFDANIETTLVLRT